MCLCTRFEYCSGGACDIIMCDQDHARRRSSAHFRRAPSQPINHVILVGSSENSRLSQTNTYVNVTYYWICRSKHRFQSKRPRNGRVLANVYICIPILLSATKILPVVLCCVAVCNPKRGFKQIKRTCTPRKRSLMTHTAICLVSTAT